MSMSGEYAGNTGSCRGEIRCTSSGPKLRYPRDSPVQFGTFCVYDNEDYMNRRLPIVDSTHESEAMY